MDFDSNEELYFSWWLDELKSKGVILHWTYQPKKFTLFEPVVIPYEKVLKTKTNIEECTLMQGHEYTADFLIYWHKKAYKKLHYPIFEISNRPIKSYPFVSNIKKETDIYMSVVDVKGSFNQNDAWRRFSIDQKWVYQKYGIYVNKIVPHPSVSKDGKPKPASALFLRTFMPERFLITDKSMRQRKIKYQYQTIDMFLRNHGIQ